MEQTERIQLMEQMLDKAAAAVDELSAALDRYDQAREAIRTLDEYYGSEAWKDDFRADEEGLLPAGLKRGVLSEDAAWNVLADNRELTVRLLETAAQTLRDRNGL
ncbi:MAG: DUF4298 domain-containing protein [Bacteroidaceae bacterium]|nr:DUF4298 domain-containing protein [Bacteroidaceae bacterium]MBR4336794.1 DUF4298 domain-containing protein [Bacteroidaceae bacterium]